MKRPGDVPPGGARAEARARSLEFTRTARLSVTLLEPMASDDLVARL